jgi:DNA-binding transcriptional LysR family regulator
VSKGDEFFWDDLRYFIRAAQTQSLSGAARALGVEHTTVGRRLTALERAFGAPVFIRGPDGLRLTPFGTRLLPVAEDVERAVRAVQEIVSSDKHKVRLAVPSGFTTLITQHLPRFLQDFPGVSLELLSGSRLVDLKKGEADLALQLAPVTDEDLVAQNMGEVGWSLYASDAYLARRRASINPRLLKGHDVIGYDESLAAVPGAQWLEVHASEARTVLRSREMTDMLAAARAGLGLALLPCLLGEPEPILRRLTAEVIGSRKLSLVYRREMLHVAPVRAVINLVATLMRENAGLISGHAIERVKRSKKARNPQSGLRS